MAAPINDSAGHTNIKAATFVLVDDDEDDRMLMRMALKQVNSSLPVVELADGLQLIDYLRREVDDQTDTHALCLIIMDVNMPVLDGPSALKQLQQHPLWRSVPVLMMSTSDDPRLIEQLLTLGAISYVVKPRTYTELVHQLQTTFEPWLGGCAEPKLHAH